MQELLKQSEKIRKKMPGVVKEAARRKMAGEILTDTAHLSSKFLKAYEAAELAVKLVDELKKECGPKCDKKKCK